MATGLSEKVSTWIPLKHNNESGVSNEYYNFLLHHRQYMGLSYTHPYIKDINLNDAVIECNESLAVLTMQY